jgi:hypothetical protein
VRGGREAGARASRRTDVATQARLVIGNVTLETRALARKWILEGPVMIGAGPGSATTYIHHQRHAGTFR